MRGHSERARRRFRSAQLVIKIKGKSLPGMAEFADDRRRQGGTKGSDLLHHHATDVSVLLDTRRPIALNLLTAIARRSDRHRG
jgi:hypothetical protein